jgi:cellulose synthase/poly-beta-1,6-N-acetylglucosamine synthase-like glycosyltransferase
VSAYVHFVLVYFLAFAGLHAGLLVLASIETRRHLARRLRSGLRRIVRSPLTPPISILVPAYNEAAGITDSVRSLLALEYPSLEVVVVSDGSTDETVAKLVEAFDLRPVQRPLPPFLPHRPVRGVYSPRGRLNLLVIDKENGGKADALNAAINFSSHPLVCGIDADSIPERTVVSGGVIRVANGCRIDRGQIVEVGLPREPLPMFQVVEYLRAFLAARTGWSAINGLLLVSGAFGLFRKDAVLAAGGYRTSTVGEDMELVVRLHRVMREQRRPYRVVFVPDPVCWTEAPNTARVLRRQRRRWHRGSVETLLMHRRMVGNPRYGAVGLLSLPVLLLFEVLGPVVEVSGYAVSMVAFAQGAIDPATFVLFLAVAVLSGLVLTVGAIALEDTTVRRHASWRDLGRMLLYAVLENAGYRQVLLVWRLEGFWQLVRKGEWGAMERRGFAPVEPAELAGQVGLR